MPCIGCSSSRYDNDHPDEEMNYICKECIIIKQIENLSLELYDHEVIIKDIIPKQKKFIKFFYKKIYWESV